MKHREANSREVEKRHLQETIHLARKMRRRESKAFTNFNSLLFKSTASWPLLYLRPLIHTFCFAAPKPGCLFLSAGNS